MTSQFQNVKEFMHTAGQKIETVPQTSIINDNPKQVDFRVSLINEEFKELLHAVKTNNFTEVVALADMLYVIHGMGHTIGVDLDKAFNIVHSSNMTKFCTSQKEAEATVENYKKKFENGDKTYDSPEYRLVSSKNPEEKTKEYYVVYNKSTGKVLKNINYTPANFKSLF